MSEINCPYCGAEDVVGDAWELGDGESYVECSECEKEFVAHGETSITFESERMECHENKHEFSDWIAFSCKEVGQIRYYRTCEHCDSFNWSGRLPEGSPPPSSNKESE